MKTIKILFILIFISLHAGATGYVHNMFVAHKKLQSGKEQVITKERASAKKVRLHVKATKHEAKAAQAGMFLTAGNTKSVTASATLNERILKEGPSSLFVIDNDDDNGESVVSKLVEAVKCVVYTFVGSAKMGNS